MQYIYDLSYEQWQHWVKEKGLPGFRAQQIYTWLGRGIERTEEMLNVPKNIRKLLDDSFIVNGLTAEDKQVSERDGTIKYSYRLADGNRIESVRMLYKHGQSVCLSSQAGCRMGCTFCASTGAGFGRNLTSGEMLAQVAAIARDTNERVSHVVIMGIGEPLDNYDAVVAFLKNINHPKGLNISLRHISVSTCGLVPEMLKFTDEGLPVTLSVSLHAPNDTLRRQLMPVARQYDISQLLAACRYHLEKTNRRISFEYALLKGINDLPGHADELASLLRTMLCHVNLIPANEFDGGLYSRSSPETVRHFQDRLTAAGINATVRRSLGTELMAACGQLRRSKEACKNK